MKIDLEIVLKAINEEPEIPENISEKIYDNPVAIYTGLVIAKKEAKIGIKNRLLNLIETQQKLLKK